MSDSGADELPPVVAVLTGDDESFLEMLARDIAALAQFREDMVAAMSGTGAGAQVGSLGVGDTAASEGAQAEAAMGAVREEAAEVAASMAEASAAAQESAESIAARLADAEAEQVAFFDSLGAVSQDTFEQMQAEGSEAAASITRISAASAAASAELEEVRVELEGTTRSVEQLVATADDLQAAMVDSFRDVESGAISAEQAVERLEAAMTAAHTITQEQGAAMLAGAAANPGASLGVLKDTAVTYRDAADAAARYGTVQAQVEMSTRLLENADAVLADANAQLMQSYMMAANGAARETGLSAEAYAALQRQLGAVADAEASVTAAIAAQIDAFNEVNLAVIRNDQSFLDEESALRGLSAAAQATGLSMDELAMQLEDGDFKTLGQAAAWADAMLQAVALEEAEQRLAAAQMTLLTSMADVAAGADMDAAQMSALRESVASAEADLSALKASAEGAGSAMSGFGGGMGMASMAGFMLISYVPQLVDWLNKISSGGDQSAVGVQNVEAAMLGLTSTLPSTGASLAQTTQALAALQAATDSTFSGVEVQGLKDMDAALAKLQQTDPELAAEEAAQLEAALEAMGLTSQQAAADLSQYNQAVQATAIQLAAEQSAVQDTVPGTLAYSDAVQQATISLEQQALQAQETAAAQESWLDTVVPGTREWAREVASSTTALQFQAQQAAISADAQKTYLSQLTPGTQQYAYALDSAQAGLMQQASSARINAQALNSLLPPTAQLSTETLNQVTAFSEVQQATSEYSNALQALYGIYGNTSAAEAAFTGDLANAKGTITTGKDAVDALSDAGYKNVQAFTQMQQQALTVAEDIYQQTGSVDQANASLQQMAQQIDTLAEKSGLSTKQVQQLNEELWGVKNIKDISVPINADTSGAKKGLSTLLSEIDSSTAFVKVLLSGAGAGAAAGANAALQVGNVTARAGGGPVVPGETYMVGENGPEVMEFGASGYITPSDMIPRLSPGSGGMSGGGGGGGVTVIMQPGAIQAGVILGEDIALVNAIQQAMGNLGNLVPDQWASVQSTRGR